MRIVSRVLKTTGKYSYQVMSPMTESRGLIPDSDEGQLWGFPLQWVPDFVSWRVKHSERETKCSSLANTEV